MHYSQFSLLELNFDVYQLVCDVTTSLVLLYSYTSSIRSLREVLSFDYCQLNYELTLLNFVAKNNKQDVLKTTRRTAQNH